jgi:hypothetical protein
MLSTSSQCVQFEESIGRGNHASIDSADNKQSNLLSFRIAIQPLQHQQSAGGERMGYIATINGIGIHFITVSYLDNHKRFYYKIYLLGTRKINQIMVRAAFSPVCYASSLPGHR